MPSEPVSIAATSDSMSPNRLSVTMTSNCFGQRTSCMPPASASMCSSCTSLYSRACTCIDDLVPQHAGLHHVALFHRGDLVAPLARQLEADARDALDLVGVVDLGVDGALLAVAEIGDGFRLAEIDAAGEFAQDDDIEALDHLALEARGIRKRRIDDRRPDIGEQAEVLAQPQQPRFRPRVVGHLVPFRPADGAEDHGVAGVRLGHGLVGDRRPCARRSRSRRPGLPRSGNRRCPSWRRNQAAVSPRP